MLQPRLVGSRIRETRLGSGIRQADLARDVGISPAYLNLIEHNRRRIGGKLVVDLARALGVEPANLTEGAEEAVLGALREGALREPAAGAELDRAEELAGRFPGWARLLAAQNRRMGELERTVEALSDRLTHDPHLAASLHDVLSAVTAIRSSASILAETDDIDPEWQARFLRNMSEDSARLSRSAQGLVDFLDAGGDVEQSSFAPQEELFAFLGERGFHIGELERGGVPDEDILAQSGAITSDAARALARAYLGRYRQDAERLPLAEFVQAWRACGGDPLAAADRAGADLPAVLRRAATLAGDEDEDAAGIVICDGSGTITFRKPIGGFRLPRFGAACPLWPLYRALARPGLPVDEIVETPGLRAERFRCVAIAVARFPAGYTGPAVYEATMLIRRAGGGAREAVPVGASCRVCPRDPCPARREPSILSAGA